MLNFINIEASEATIKYHEALAPNSLGINLFFGQNKFAPLML